MASVARDTLTRYLDELLKPEGFKDYCPNGLQVEGKAKRDQRGPEDLGGVDGGHWELHYVTEW